LAGVKLSSKNATDIPTQQANSFSPGSPVPILPQEKIETKITGKKLILTGSFATSRIDLVSFAEIYFLLLF
jgi:hypothetical protein